MYKHFQASNPNQICERLNSTKSKIHSIEHTNGMIQCIAEPCDDDREIKFISGSVLSVTKQLNDYGRKIEGKVIILGHRASAFYRVDEKKEAEMQAAMDKAASEAKKAAEKAEKDAKKAEMKKKMDELKKEMESVDSEPSDSEKEEMEKQAKTEKAEAKRQEALKKAKAKKAKEEKEDK